MLADGAEATIRSAQARGSFYDTELTDQELPLPPLAQWEIDAQIEAEELAPPMPKVAAAEPAPVPGDVITRSFVQSNPRAVTWANWYSATQIVEIDGETRRAIRRIVKSALEPRRDVDDRFRGRPPAQSARSIKAKVGLTSRQHRAVDNLRNRMLDAGDRARRHGRSFRVDAFGGQLTYDVSPGGPTERQLAGAQRQYSRALHQWRAMNIARTETIDSASEGQRQTWLAARDQGWLDGTEKREWLITPDDRLCPICRRMAGQVRGLEEPFDAGKFGFVMGPTAHPQ